MYNGDWGGGAEIAHDMQSLNLEVKVEKLSGGGSFSRGEQN